MNYSIKIDLLKLKGAFMRELQGKTAAKKCIIIPVEENDIYVGQKGCYLDLTGIEMANPQFGDTHFVKPDIPKAKRETMTDEQRRAVPILGGMRAIQPRQQQTTTMMIDDHDNSQEETATNDELPF